MEPSVSLTRTPSSPYLLLPLPPMPLPNAPSSSVLGSLVYTRPIDTCTECARGGVASAIIVLRFFTSIPCTVHKSSGAREAIGCVIEGVWNIQGVIRLPVNVLGMNRPVSAFPRGHLPEHLLCCMYRTSWGARKAQPHGIKVASVASILVGYRTILSSILIDKLHLRSSGFR